MEKIFELLYELLYGPDNGSDTDGAVEARTDEAGVNDELVVAGMDVRCLVTVAVGEAVVKYKSRLPKFNAALKKKVDAENCAFNQDFNQDWTTDFFVVKDMDKCLPDICQESLASSSTSVVGNQPLQVYLKSASPQVEGLVRFSRDFAKWKSVLPQQLEVGAATSRIVSFFPPTESTSASPSSICGASASTL